MTRWDDNLDTLRDVSYYATHAVNGWQRANEISTLTGAEQYKTFLSYINAVGMEVYSNMEYKNVLEAKSMIEIEGNNIDRGLDKFYNNYETFFENDLRPAMGEIVRDTLIHVSSLDRGLSWREASNKRFSKWTYRSYFHTSTDENGHPRNLGSVPFPGRMHPFYNELNKYSKGIVVIEGNKRAKYAVRNHVYTYSVNGIRMKITIIDIKEGDKNEGLKTYVMTPFSLHTYAKYTQDSPFNPADFTYLRSVDGYYLYETEPNLPYRIKDYYETHKEIEYINFLQNGFEPALHILDSWYNKFLKEGNTSREDVYPMQAEKDLKKYYKDRTWSITGHATVISNKNLPSDVIVQPGAALAILNGGGLDAYEYSDLCRTLGITRDYDFAGFIQQARIVNRQGDISVPLFHSITVRKGATIVLPAETYLSLRSKGLLVIEEGARVVRLDKYGRPPGKINPSVLPGILNILLK